MMRNIKTNKNEKNRTGLGKELKFSEHLIPNRVSY